MKLKNTVLAIGLSALIAGCSTYNTLKKEELSTQDNAVEEYTEAPMRVEMIGGLYHELDEGSMTVEYLTHPLTPWDIKAGIKIFSENSLSEVREAEPLAVYMCKGTKNRNSYFIPSSCSENMPRNLERKLMVPLDLFSN